MAAASPNALANTPAPSNSTATTPRGLANLSALLPSLVPVPLTPYSNVQSNFSKNIRNPYYHHFSLGVQHQLPANIVLDIAYVGSLGRQLLFTNPLNPAIPNATFTGTATETTAFRSRHHPLRPESRLHSDTRLGADSNYNALQVQVRRRTSPLRLEPSPSPAPTPGRRISMYSRRPSPATPSASESLTLSCLWHHSGFMKNSGPSDNDRRNVSGHLHAVADSWSVR